MTVASVKDLIVQTETTLNLAAMEAAERERVRQEAIADSKWDKLTCAYAQTAVALTTKCQLEPHAYSLAFGEIVPSPKWDNGTVIVLNVHADDDVHILTTETVVFDWGVPHAARVSGTNVYDGNGCPVSTLPDFLRALRWAAGEVS